MVERLRRRNGARNRGPLALGRVGGRCPASCQTISKQNSAADPVSSLGRNFRNRLLERIAEQVSLDLVELPQAVHPGRADLGPSVDQATGAGGILEAMKPNDQMVEAEAYGLMVALRGLHKPHTAAPERSAALFSRTLSRYLSYLIVYYGLCLTLKIRVPIPAPGGGNLANAMREAWVFQLKISASTAARRSDLPWVRDP